MPNLNAYEVLENRRIEDVSSQAMILRHKKTGARVAVLSNEDDNKVFYIGFRTTPKDETGVPHIIEHTTLCGSEKYPVKDPFIELVKGSLNTFLNAMTYPDKTVYPLASYNDHDFKNLMDVYLDAVFHPNITKYREIFKQEGWHYEITDPSEPITVNGVVYNEMKGAYSSPEEVLQTAVYKSLFPDNTYSKDSGGNPVHIPELTYEAYLDFYHKYYHPSNSYIYLYGDMDVEERLDYIDRQYLSAYDYLQADSEVKTQAPFDAPAEYVTEFSVSSDDPEENAAYLSYNRVVGNSLDRMLYQAFDILDYALVSAPGAPVREALIAAGIGDDVSGSFEGGIKQPVFSITAKNANASDAEKFESIIRRVLTEQADKGIDREALLAGINSNEFRFREADFGQFPKGLLFGLQCLDSWIFDDMAPFIHLECLDTFEKLRQNISTGYFENLVRKYLLNNNHGSLVLALPKKGKMEEEENVLAEKLQRYKDSLTAEEIDAMIRDTEALKAYQAEPSRDEDLAKIPALGREDLRKEALEYSNIETNLDGVLSVVHDINSNGIDYFTLMFDAEDVKTEDLGYLMFMTKAMGLLDTASYTYSDLSNLTDIYTGGISEFVHLYSDCKDGSLKMKMDASVKVLSGNLEKSAELLEEILLTSNWTDTRRLKEIAAQTKSRLQNTLSEAGHIISASRGCSSFSEHAYYQDSLNGIRFYRTICAIEKELKENPENVTLRLQNIQKQVIAKNRLTVSFTSNMELYHEAEPVLLQLIHKLPEYQPMGEKPQVTLIPQKEGFTDASQIQYVARCGNFKKKGFSYSGNLRLLKQILSLDYLWIAVRVQGGAYGAMNNFGRNGDSYFVSYRDPHLKKTVKAFEGLIDYIRSFKANEQDMTKYIIGTFGEMDTPMNPEAKGRRSMRAYLENVTFDMIQKERDEILNARQEDINALADLAAAILEDDALCVIGNETMIRKSGDMFDHIEKLV